MRLNGKDLKTYSNLVRYLDERLTGFTTTIDELTGEVIIRTHLTAGTDGTLIDLVSDEDDDGQDVIPDTPRVWLASPNGDWWSTDDAYVYVLKETDLDDIDPEEVEGDKFEDVIMEHGVKVPVKTDLI